MTFVSSLYRQPSIISSEPNSPFKNFVSVFKWRAAAKIRATSFSTWASAARTPPVPWLAPRMMEPRMMIMIVRWSQGCSRATTARESSIVRRHSEATRMHISGSGLLWDGGSGSVRSASWANSTASLRSRFTGPAAVAGHHRLGFNRIPWSASHLPLSQHRALGSISLVDPMLGAFSVAIGYQCALGQMVQSKSRVILLVQRDSVASGGAVTLAI